MLNKSQQQQRETDVSKRMDGRNYWTAGLLGSDPKASTSPRGGLEAETGEQGQVSGGRGRGRRGSEGLISPEATRTLHPASGPQALAEAQLAVVPQAWDGKPESALLTKPRAALQPRATWSPSLGHGAHRTPPKASSTPAPWGSLPESVFCTVVQPGGSRAGVKGERGTQARTGLRGDRTELARDPAPRLSRPTLAAQHCVLLVCCSRPAFLPSFSPFTVKSADKAVFFLLSC